MNIHVDGSHDLPDVGNGELPCCYGSAEYGPGRCTCWKPKYDSEQQPPQHGPMRIRPKMCRDCAFRHDSPERAGDERYAHSGEDGIEELLSGDGVFVCHQGLRRTVLLVHPNGAEHDPGPMAYSPPEPVVRADGRPAELCAGWAAELRRRGEL